MIHEKRQVSDLKIFCIAFCIVSCAMFLIVGVLSLIKQAHDEQAAWKAWKLKEPAIISAQIEAQREEGKRLRQAEIESQNHPSVPVFMNPNSRRVLTDAEVGLATTYVVDQPSQDQLNQQILYEMRRANDIAERRESRESWDALEASRLPAYTPPIELYGSSTRIGNTVFTTIHGY